MERRKVTGEIQVYTKKTRDQLYEIGLNFFRKEKITHFLDDVFSCMDELIKNAIKANYKFILIHDKMCEEIAEENPEYSNDQICEKAKSIIKDKQKYDEVAGNIAKKYSISLQVRSILNEESVQLRVKNKAYEEKRKLVEDELDQLSQLRELASIRRKMIKQNVKVLVKVETDGKYLYMEVTNTAPILAKDLNRIHDKRDEFKSFREEGREYEFFIQNLDTSESGFGLGYATIDSFLGNMGLDPYKSVQILAASDTTVILALPVDVLQAKAY